MFIKKFLEERLAWRLLLLLEKLDFWGEIVAVVAADCVGLGDPII